MSEMSKIMSYFYKLIDSLGESEIALQNLKDAIDYYKFPWNDRLLVYQHDQLIKLIEDFVEYQRKVKNWRQL